tara:strand:- start:7051 stop:7665 length:615 start_codon:yes stop_codon:yes gene_type:complete
MEHKMCTKCNKSFPATNEYFNKRKSKLGRYALNPTCITCLKDRKREEKKRYKAKHRVKINKRRTAKRKIRYHNDPKYRNKVLLKRKRYADTSEVWKKYTQSDKHKEACKKGAKKYRLKMLSDPEIKKIYDEKRKERRKNDPDRYKKKTAQEVRNLPDGYIKHCMRRSLIKKGLTTQDLTPEIIDTQRSIILLKRALNNNNPVNQ